MEWYVLRYDEKKQEVALFNIFSNAVVNRAVDVLIEEMLYSYDFDEICDFFDKELQYAFWSRVEYEISVGKPFENDVKKLQKIDIYSQLKPNIPALVSYILNSIDA